MKLENNPNRYMVNLILFAINLLVLALAIYRQDRGGIYFGIFIAIFNGGSAALNYALRTHIKSKNRQAFIDDTIGTRIE